ncbi:MAG: HNH endonuclease [Methylocystis sp.]|uniref:HNH endonuclease n=1 Tax=Methylocystis sp. TaxID=1911079 RepID=UPI003DA50862
MANCSKCGAALAKKRDRRKTDMCNRCATGAALRAKAKRPFIEHRGIRYYREKQGWQAHHGHGARRRLHVVLWEEAHGPIPPGHFVACIDGQVHNNALDNLELRRKGSHLPRERRPSEWTPEKVRRIASLAGLGISHSNIAKLIGSTQQRVSGKLKRMANEPTP